MVTEGNAGATELEAARSRVRALASFYGTLLVIGVAYVVLAWATSGAGELWDSPVWGWGWLVLPLVAGIAAVGGPPVWQARGIGRVLVEGVIGPGSIALALVGPQFVAFMIVFATSRDVTLEPIGLLFLMVLWGVTTAGAMVGAGIRAVRRRRG